MTIRRTPCPDQHFDVLLFTLLEVVLIADPARRVASATLLVPEDCEVDAGGLEDADHRGGDASRALVVGDRAANPVQVRSPRRGGR